MKYETKFHDSIEGIKVGSRVASRSTGEDIGEVDSLGEGNGQRWAIVSWPVPAHPDIVRDERGRRGQAFDLMALQVVEADRPGDLTGEDYDRLFGPPDPYEPDPFGAAAAGWDALDCGGVYDGFQVVSDADGGL